MICDFFTGHPNYDISFSVPSGVSYWLLQPWLLKKMKEAGFYRLSFSIETGNKRMVDFIGKPVDLQKAKETIAIANQMGFWTQGNFIIGFPDETRQEIEKTISYACDSGLDFPVFFIAKPYAGSELTDICASYDLRVDRIDTTDLNTTAMDTLTLRACEINALRKSAVKKALMQKAIYLTNPLNSIRFLCQKIRSWRDLKYFVKVLRNVWKLI
jgi:radical SAM superfamily enzyme YgiQ (UPF0313 family)